MLSAIISQLEINKRFIAFEKQHNLFDLKDSNGFYVWDVIRYDLYINLMWDFNNTPEIKPTDLHRFHTIWVKVKNLIGFFMDRKKYNNFFFLCSRNKKDGKLFDQNAYGTLKSLTDNFLFESFFSDTEKTLFNNSFYNIPQALNRRRFKVCYDFTDLIAKITSEFGRCPFTQYQLQKLLSDFHSDFNFFKKLLSRKGIKRVFVTQNGTQSGLFAAAASLGIPSFEFQHGVVNLTHLGYHYPEGTYKPNQIYLADTMFSLSDFWFKDIYMPNTKIIPLGNDFFAPQIKPLNAHSNAITVISADIYGLVLKNFIVENINDPRIQAKRIVFKLHPNQFQEFEYYKSEFQKYPNVEVVANERSMADLLAESHTVFTVQSTGVYEALQSGRKAVLLQEAGNNWYDRLLHNPNLIVINNADEFFEALNKPIKPYEDVYFDKFNADALMKALA